MTKAKQPLATNASLLEVSALSKADDGVLTLEQKHCKSCCIDGAASGLTEFLIEERLIRKDVLGSCADKKETKKGKGQPAVTADCRACRVAESLKKVSPDQFTGQNNKQCSECCVPRTTEKEVVGYSTGKGLFMQTFHTIGKNQYASCADATATTLDISAKGRPATAQDCTKCPVVPLKCRKCEKECPCVPVGGGCTRSADCMGEKPGEFGVCDEGTCALPTIVKAPDSFKPSMYHNLSKQMFGAICTDCDDRLSRFNAGRDREWLNTAELVPFLRFQELKYLWTLPAVANFFHAEYDLLGQKWVTAPAMGCESCSQMETEDDCVKRRACFWRRRGICSSCALLDERRCKKRRTSCAWSLPSGSNVTSAAVCMPRCAMHKSLDTCKHADCKWDIMSSICFNPKVEPMARYDKPCEDSGSHFGNQNSASTDNLAGESSTILEQSVKEYLELPIKIDYTKPYPRSVYQVTRTNQCYRCIVGPDGRIRCPVRIPLSRRRNLYEFASSPQCGADCNNRQMENATMYRRFLKDSLYAIADNVMDHVQAVPGVEVMSVEEDKSDYFVCNERLAVPTYKGVNEGKDYRLLGGLLVTNRAFRSSPTWSPADENGWTMISYTMAVQGWKEYLTGSMDDKVPYGKDRVSIKQVLTRPQDDPKSSFRQEPSAVMRLLSYYKAASDIATDKVQTCRVNPSLTNTGMKSYKIFGVPFAELPRSSSFKPESNKLCTPCELGTDGVGGFFKGHLQILCGRGGSKEERRDARTKRFAGLPNLADGLDSEDEEDISKRVDMVLNQAFSKAKSTRLNGGIFKAILEQAKVKEPYIEIAVCNEMVIPNFAQESPYDEESKLVAPAFVDGEELYAATLCFKMGLSHECFQLAAPTRLLDKSACGHDKDLWALADDTPGKSDYAKFRAKYSAGFSMEASVKVKMDDDKEKEIGSYEAKKAYGEFVHHPRMGTEFDHINVIRQWRALQGRAVNLFFKPPPPLGSKGESDQLLLLESVDTFLFDKFVTDTSMRKSDPSLEPCVAPELESE